MERGGSDSREESDGSPMDHSGTIHQAEQAGQCLYGL